MEVYINSNLGIMIEMIKIERGNEKVGEVIMRLP